MIEKLEDIGFYTLSNARAWDVSWNSPMWRCELILTDKCNFNCPYCRGPKDEWKGTLSLEDAQYTLKLWIDEGLRNVRFSGGEPLLYPGLVTLVGQARDGGVRRIAVSTNGSFPLSKYHELVKAGVNDFSISLDSCCSSGCKQMSGGKDAFYAICDNITKLSRICYVTVGIVLNDENSESASATIRYASTLGASDIRIISAAQDTKALFRILEQLRELPPELLAKHPILKYRIANLLDKNRNVRGLCDSDAHRCHLLKDDMIVAGNHHYPCVIHMREHGEAIGKVGENMRMERYKFFLKHDPHNDPICKANCLDVCIDHNNKCESFAPVYHRD